MHNLKFLFMAVMMTFMALAITVDVYAGPHNDHVKRVRTALVEKHNVVLPADRIKLPVLDDELGFLEQSVILVKFGVENWKSLGGLGICSLILLFLISLLKSKFGMGLFKKLDPLVKRLVVTLLGQGVGIVGAMYGGAEWKIALVAGLLTSGGAVAIYEVTKPVLALKKKKKKKKA